MRAALTAHDDVLRNTIESHGGWLFKHTGDGVIAAFASPHSAIDAAVAAQRALELPVRMGIATGEAERPRGRLHGLAGRRLAGNLRRRVGVARGGPGHSGRRDSGRRELVLAGIVSRRMAFLTALAAVALGIVLLRTTPRGRV